MGEKLKIEYVSIDSIKAYCLICGDSTDPAVIDRLMDGVKADGIKRTD